MAKKHSFKSHILSFKSLLNSKDLSAVSSHAYCLRYLQHLTEHSNYYLSIYADVLEKMVSHSDYKKEQICLLDYGAGNGLLGIFAKYCGIGKVYINDISTEFIAAAKNLSKILGIQIDGFIAGDIEMANGFSINAIVGTDVIEHIYDLNSFMSALNKINPNMVSVFTTASNPKNIFKVNQLKKLQRKDELTGGDPEDFILFGSESHESFFQMRKKIITETAPHINELNADKLAEYTRGMNRHDIIVAVNFYLSTGNFPNKINHPTNTCNPISGSWTERILRLEEYEEIYNANSYRLSVFNGFYDIHKNGLKKIINVTLNKSICILGKLIAPYIILVGRQR